MAKWTTMLLLALTVATQAEAADKFGVTARGFLAMTQENKMLYTAGVTDALAIMGVSCPIPVPTYGEIISLAEAQIWRSYAKAEEIWAATAIMAASYDRGCKRQ